MIGMTDSHGQGISGIAARCAAEPEQGAHHLLHLPFFRLPVSGHRLLNHPGRVIMHRHTLFHDCRHCRASGLAQLKGRADIMGHKEILYRRDPRLMLLHHLGKSIKDDQQASGKILFRTRADSAAGDKLQSRPLLVNNPIAGDPGTGIDADNTYRLGLPIMRPKSAYDRASMISSGISKLACTFWTSS
jgi:hypothetical protein